MSGALDIALSLAASGIPVFPCGKNKRPAIAEADGGHGFHDAKTDLEEIRDLFRRAPHAILVGTPTGESCGFDVLDIDYRNGGGVWEDANLHRLPETRIHKTQSGGRHYLFRHVHGVRNSAGHVKKDGSIGGVAIGVDVRGDGGYVIMPPSMGYAIDSDADIAEWPDWLLEAVLSRPPEATVRVNGYRPGVIDSRRLDGFVRAIIDRVSRAGEGSKHWALRNAALSLGGIQQAAGLSDTDATQMLLAALPTTVKDWANAAKTVAWGLDRGRSRPIELEDREHNGHPSESEPPPEMPDDPAYWESVASDAVESEPDPEPTPAPEQSPLPLLWFSEIEPIFDARDFVAGLFIEQASAVVYGQSNSGKTFWTTDLALHIAAGLEWNGRAVEQGGVVYCVLEGGIGFRNRVSAWKEDRGLGGYDLPFVAIPSGLNLLKPEADSERLIEAVTIAAKRMKVPVKLIVIDTLARALAGGNENAPEDMGALVLNMDKIREATKAMVLFVHHSGKDQARGARGHSSLQAAIDTEIEVVDTESGGIRTAEVVKQRELPKGDTFTFALRVVDLGPNPRGIAVTTCVVDYGDSAALGRGHAAGAASARRHLKGHNKRALEVLIDLCAVSGEAGYAGVPSGVVSVPEKWWRDRFYDRSMPGESDDAKQKAFKRASTALINEHLAGMSNRRVWCVDRKNTGHESGQNNGHSGQS